MARAEALDGSAAMSTCKDCICASFNGYCDLKQEWKLDAPACELFELHPDKAMLHNADRAIRAKEKELAAVHGTVSECFALLREMILELVLAMSGNGDPMTLNRRLEDFADRMESLGALEASTTGKLGTTRTRSNHGTDH